MPPEDRDDLPGGWTLAPLAKCVDVLDSRRKPVNSKERASRVGAIPYYGATGQVGWIDDDLFDEEIVLLGEDGAPFYDKSKPIAYIVDGKSWVNNHAHVLRARPEVTSNRFIKYYLDSFDFNGYVQGSTRDKLTQGAMNSIPVLLPPRELQDELVNVIETVEGKRASAGSHLAVARRAIERFRQAVLTAACSGRLTASWREAHLQLGQSADELLRELRSPGGKRVDPESSAEALLDLPETWRVATGAEAFVFVTSGSRGWAKYYSDEGPAFLRVGNLDRHRLDLDLTVVQAVRPPSSAESRRTRAQPGDLLISITAEVGMVGVVPSDLGEGYVNQHVAIARSHPRLNPRFLAAFVAAPSYGEAQLDALQRGATKAGLGLDDIRALCIPLPPFEEQVEIARRVDQLMSLADRLDSRIDAASRRIDRSSQAVLAKAFRGDLISSSDAVLPTGEELFS
jgi:type I restriction enzyme S subunit